MRITDVHKTLSEDVDLFEVNMSPSNLKKMASAITGAQAGMEFEMIVPGAAGDDETDLEPDYDYDESISDFDDIENFFTGGDNPNSRRDVRDVIQGYRDKYDDYIMEKQGEEWARVELDEVTRYIEENSDRDDLIRAALDNMGLDSDEVEAAMDAASSSRENRNNPEERARIQDTQAYHHWSEADDAADDMIKERVEEAIREQNDDWQAAEDEWRDGFDNPSEAEFLEDEGINSMLDVYHDSGDLVWPHLMSTGNGGQPVEDVAEEFGNAIGRPWNASSSYHGAKRDPGKYVVEPDGSLDPDDPGSEAGLEFVSPPLPVTELLNDLRKVISWAKGRGCYTNESTGLHMNVSVPGFSIEKLDYVKLALFIGDEYILKQFDRVGNTYCKSALGLVKQAATPEKAAEVLAKMKQQLNTVAGKVIHSGITSKYTSINTKDGYIEFRSPGGNWLDANIDVLENTLLRFVVGMNIALDENAYKEEYAKKLYKLIAPSDDSTNTLQYFAKFNAGEIPKAALRSFIKQAQLNRKVEREKKAGKKYWWNVQWDSTRRMEVVAGSAEVAKQVAAEEWGVSEDRLANAIVTPIRPYEEPTKPNLGGTEGNWGVWITSGSRFARLPGEHPAGQEIPVRRFQSREAAQAFLDQTRQNNPNMRTDIEVREIPADYEAPPPAGRQYQAPADQFRSTETVPREGRPNNLTPHGPGPWEIYYRVTGTPVRPLEHTNRQAAEAEARSALGLRGLDPMLHGIRTRQSAPSGPTGHTFTGEWRVVNGTGQELYRFGGVGNNQSDANRIAGEWARRNAPAGTDFTQLSVVPVMA